MFERAYAEVAELADALDSGSSARKGVRVQIPASAPPLPSCILGKPTAWSASMLHPDMASRRSSIRPLAKSGLGFLPFLEVDSPLVA